MRPMLIYAVVALSGLLVGGVGTGLVMLRHRTDDAPAVEAAAHVVAETAGVVEAVTAPAVVEAETAATLAAPDVAILVCGAAIEPDASSVVQSLCLCQMGLRAIEGAETGAGIGARELCASTAATIAAGAKAAP